MGMHAARRAWRLTAVALVAVSTSACSDDSPDDDPPAGSDALDTPEGVSDAGSTIVDPEVPASNVSNEQHAPLDPPGS
jgi:hypothetical protein